MFLCVLRAETLQLRDQENSKCHAIGEHMSPQDAVVSGTVPCIVRNCEINFSVSSNVQFK